MLKRCLTLVAFACGLGCIAAPPSPQQPVQDWVQMGENDVHPTRILVRFKQGASAQMQATTFNSLGVNVRRQFQLVPGLAVLDAQQGSYVAATATAQERADALLSRIEALRNTGQFEYVEPDYVVHADLQPTDTAFQDGTLWGLRNLGNQGGVADADIDADQAWDITTGSTNVIVAVIDTGVRYTHQELALQMWRNPGESGGGKETNGIDDDGDGYVDDVFGINAITGSGDPFDDNNHGTHVSGTIGAQANGGGPHVGVAWNVQIMACKFLSAFGSGTYSDAIEALNFAVLKGAKISNNSWGGYGFSQGLFDAISAARGSNHLFMAAAGNEAVDNDVFPHYPSSFNLDNVVSVAALDRADNLANFSNYGQNSVDLGAPGVSIYSCIAASDSSYAFFNGTSMATPHVAGVAALLKALHPSDTYLQLRERLLLTTVPISSLAGLCVTGGRLNAYNALFASPDGVLELSVTPPTGTEVLGGSITPVFVRVTDFFAILNATVTASISTGGTLTFLDNGVPPDADANNAIYTANLNVPTGVTNVTLTITATASGKTGVTNAVTYVVVPPPPNDYFTNATKIPTAGGLVTGNNKFATREPGEPFHAGTSGERSLWWNWSPATTGPVLIDTAGSTFDTVIGVYTGNSVSSLTEIASVDDSDVSLQGYLVLNATNGVTYRIAISGYSSTEFGTVRLRVEPNGVPDTNAPLVFITSPVSGSVILTNQTNQIVVSGVATDPTPNASGVSEVQLLVNGALVATSATGTTNWSAIVLLSLGVNTIEALAFDFAGNLSFSDVIAVTYMPPPLTNDHFVNATALTGNSGTNSVNTTTATKEFGEPIHANNNGGKSVWWKFTAPADGVLFLSTSNSSFDTLLGVYTGSHVTNLTTVGSNDDAPGGGFFSEISQPVVGGQIYRIAVDGYAGASGTAQLMYSFTPTVVYMLTITNTSGGTVTPSSGLVASNATVILTALPNQQFGFSSWSGSVTAMTNPLSIVVQSNMTLMASFGPLPHTDGFETGNLMALGWIAGGNAPWIVQGTNVAAGSFAARSGVIGNNQTSSLILSSNFQAGSGSFDYKVSSEQGWDFLRFYVDGVLSQQWSGEVGWSEYIFPLTAGLHTLEWRYTKDVDTAVGIDAAFIDNVDLPVGVPVGPGSAAQLLLTPQPDGSFTLNVIGQTNQTYVVQSSTNLLAWQSISTNVTVAGEIHIPVNNAGGTCYYRAFVPGP